MNDLIQQSVENYLNRESFSSSKDVARILKDMGLPVGSFEPLMAELDEMMKRRHQIVNKADLPTFTSGDSVPWTYVTILI